jgi:hypothetical protein
MSAADVSAATTTVEAATAANCFTAADCATAESAGDCAASDRATVPAIPTVPTVAATITRASVDAAVEPRASTDEQATGEVARTVVTIRCAGVRVIPIVAVGADRSWADVARTYAHADCDALSISVRR